MDDRTGISAVAHTETSQKATRRDFLYIATGAVGAVGVAGMVWPFVSQLQPDASVLALSTTEVDLSPIAEGQIVTVQWRGKPIFISHRTKKEIEEAQQADIASMKDPQPDADRVKAGKDEWLVAIGICTHLGCSPSDKLAPGPQPSLPDDWQGGFLCACHGSTFDVAGRVFKNKPAPDNLEVPPHYYTSETTVLIGEEKQA